MNDQPQTNVILFVFAFLLSLLLTLTSALTLKLRLVPVESSKIIIFPHPENAS